jgi:hypothetical protein
MTAAEKLFHKIGNEIEGANKSQMFGWTCYKIGKTAFISFEQDCMIFKLSKETIAEAMLLNGAYIFIPNKKTPMNNWVCIPYQHKKLWKPFAEAAKNFILQ